MDKKNLSISLVIGLVAIVASVLLGGESTQTVIKEIRDGKVGAVASPDIMSPYISFGGQQLWAHRSTALPTASTTLCAIAAPSASSTLIKAGLRIDTATATAATLTIHKSGSQWLKTTLLAQDALAANNVGTMIATSTANDTVFTSGDYLVFGMSQVYTTATPQGACFAIWSQL